MIIWLSGPTGAGKTSIARSLGASGYSVVEEDVPEDLFRAFGVQPIANCESLQRQLMQMRVSGWHRVANAPCIAFDRSIDEDVEVFCRMHKGAGLLTQMQFDTLVQFGRDLQSQIPKPDLIVFVNADRDVLLRRIQGSGAPAPVVANLDHQIALYSEWLRRRTEEVLELNTTRLSGQTISKFLGEIRSC